MSEIELLSAFVVGGLLCLLGQLIMDLTPFNVTPAHILVGYVTGGAILTALGLYQPLVAISQYGATVPLSGFGYSLAKGAIDGISKNGLLGVFSGGIEATAVGIVAAIIFGYSMAVIFRARG